MLITVSPYVANKINKNEQYLAELEKLQDKYAGEYEQELEQEIRGKLETVYEGFDCEIEVDTISSDIIASVMFNNDFADYRNREVMEDVKFTYNVDKMKYTDFYCEDYTLLIEIEKLIKG